VEEGALLRLRRTGAIDPRGIAALYPARLYAAMYEKQRMPWRRDRERAWHRYLSHHKRRRRVDGPRPAVCPEGQNLGRIRSRRMPKESAHRLRRSSRIRTLVPRGAAIVGNEALFEPNDAGATVACMSDNERRRGKRPYGSTKCASIGKRSACYREQRQHEPLARRGKTWDDRKIWPNALPSLIRDFRARCLVQKSCGS